MIWKYHIYIIICSFHLYLNVLCSFIAVFIIFLNECGVGYIDQTKGELKFGVTVHMGCVSKQESPGLQSLNTCGVHIVRKYFQFLINNAMLKNLSDKKEDGYCSYCY